MDNNNNNKSVLTSYNLNNIFVCVISFKLVETRVNFQLIEENVMKKSSHLFGRFGKNGNAY